jgi:hypothetical protein
LEISGQFYHRTLVRITGRVMPCDFSRRFQEKVMKKNIYVGIAALVIVPMLNASPKRSNSDPYMRGTVVDVQKHKIYSPDPMIGGSNPSDAPLASRYYAYEVSVRVDCKTYVGRYETPFHYLPSAFTPDQPIQVRLTRHVMYFDLPNDPDMRMCIVRRRTECSPNR